MCSTGRHSWITNLHSVFPVKEGKEDDSGGGEVYDGNVSIEDVALTSSMLMKTFGRVLGMGKVVHGNQDDARDYRHE